MRGVVTVSFRALEYFEAEYFIDHNFVYIFLLHYIIYKEIICIFLSAHYQRDY